MEMVNLTPHTIVLIDGETRIEIPSSGVARVASKPGVHLSGVFWAGTSYGEVEGLPEPKTDTIYIVSGLVAGRVGSSRDDVFSPGTGPNDGAERNEKGHITGVTRLIRSH